MGGKTSRPTGANFETLEADRQHDAAADDIPVIPYLKIKGIQTDLTHTLRQSIWVANYKRAFRGYLRRNPEKSQIGTRNRIHTDAVFDAEKLGLPKDSYKILIQLLVTNLGKTWDADATDFLVERGKLSATASQEERERVTNSAVSAVFKQMADQIVLEMGRVLYEKYSRTGQWDVSEADDGESEEEKLRIEKLKQASMRAVAAERERAAAAWQATLDREAAAAKAASAPNLVDDVLDNISAEPAKPQPSAVASEATVQQQEPAAAPEPSGGGGIIDMDAI